MTTPADLKPGQSVYDHDHPLRARYIHSVTKGDDGQWLVRWGHPDGDPTDEDQVPADKEFVIIAEADGTRP